MHSLKIAGFHLVCNRHSFNLQSLIAQPAIVDHSTCNRQSHTLSCLQSSISHLILSAIVNLHHLRPTSVDLQSTAIIVSSETPIAATATVRSHYDRSQQPPP
ncbi:hypothetical protein Hanom_Chr02g00130091 [Helianthus anomalus]